MTNLNSPHDEINGIVDTICKQISASVCASAAESEYAALFINGQAGCFPLTYSKPSDTLDLDPHQFTATTQLHKELLNEMSPSDDLKPFTPDITGYGTDATNNNIPSSTRREPLLTQITSRSTTHAPNTSYSCHDSYINHLKRRPKIQYFQRGCIEDI